MAKKIIGDCACEECRSHGRDKTGNHMILFKNEETEEVFGSCNRCGSYKLFDKGNMPTPNEKKELSPEELQTVLDECLELPQGDLIRRLIPKTVAERYDCRIGLSQVDGHTPESYFFPRERGGDIVGYEVKLLDQKRFYYVGSVKEADFFGLSQAQRGDVYNKKLFIFEDPLSCMSGFHVLTAYTTATNIKPACVALPFGAGSISSVMSRNRDFLNGFEESCFVWIMTKPVKKHLLVVVLCILMRNLQGFLKVRSNSTEQIKRLKMRTTCFWLVVDKNSLIT